jgi:hypothetical protein
VGTPLIACGRGRASGCGKSRRGIENAANGAWWKERQNVFASENVSGNENEASATVCVAMGAKKQIKTSGWCDMV